jgi:aminoglycoside 3-N-acetyltransferase I
VIEDGDIHIYRLGAQDQERARRTFTLMAEVFGEEHARLSDAYLERLLARPELLAFAAIRSGQVVGGLTAHTLMMTAVEGSQVFLYDIAVAPEHQRHGVGRRLVDALRREAASQGISTMFVPAEDEDVEALQFYTALGGTPSKVTHFEFSPQ